MNIQDSKISIYDQVTNKIISDLENEIHPWIKPWKTGNSITRPLRFNGLPYSGINVLLLWMGAVEKSFNSSIWMTFNQAHKLGGHVRKNEKGSFVVYANNTIQTEYNDDTDEEEEHKIFFLKKYTVFNVEQIENLPDKFYTPPEPILPIEERPPWIDRFFTAIGADIHHGGDRAYYSERTNYIQMPPFEYFKSKENYYATLAHELVHWTRHPTRLDREFGQKTWGDEGYAMEELVAELGSAYLCADLSITPEVMKDHSSYISSWLKILKNDNWAIFRAASHAQKAVDFIHKKATE